MQKCNLLNKGYHVYFWKHLPVDPAGVREKIFQKLAVQKK